MINIKLIGLCLAGIGFLWLIVCVLLGKRKNIGALKDELNLIQGSGYITEHTAKKVDDVYRGEELEPKKRRHVSAEAEAILAAVEKEKANARSNETPGIAKGTTILSEINGNNDEIISEQSIGVLGNENKDGTAVLEDGTAVLSEGTDVLADGTAVLGEQDSANDGTAVLDMSEKMDENGTAVLDDSLGSVNSDNDNEFNDEPENKDIEEDNEDNDAKNEEVKSEMDNPSDATGILIEDDTLNTESGNKKNDEEDNEDSDILIEEDGFIYVEDETSASKPKTSDIVSSSEVKDSDARENDTSSASNEDNENAITSSLEETENEKPEKTNDKEIEIEDEEDTENEIAKETESEDLEDEEPEEIENEEAEEIEDTEALDLIEMDYESLSKEDQAEMRRKIEEKIAKLEKELAEQD